MEHRRDISNYFNKIAPTSESTFPVQCNAELTLRGGKETISTFLVFNFYKNPSTSKFEDVETQKSNGDVNCKQFHKAHGLSNPDSTELPISIKPNPQKK
jgi:hypothetical protein